METVAREKLPCRKKPSTETDSRQSSALTSLGEKQTQQMNRKRGRDRRVADRPE